MSTDRLRICFCACDGDLVDVIRCLYVGVAWSALNAVSW